MGEAGGAGCDGKGHNLTLGTSQTERMRITSDGYVGIGKTDPDYELDVAGTTKSPYVIITPSATSTPDSGLCDEYIERGRLAVTSTSNVDHIYVCRQTSSSPTYEWTQLD